MNPKKPLLITHYALLIFIVWSAFAIRIYDIDRESIWWDESLSLYRAAKSIPFILSNKIILPGDVEGRDLHPPLYFLFLHFALKFGGESDFVLRFPSAFFGVLTVPLLYAAGRRVARAAQVPRGGIGVFAALFGAISPFYIWYSQEMRPYSLVLFLSLLSVYSLAIMQSNKSANGQIGKSANPQIRKWANIWQKPFADWRMCIFIYVLSTIAMLYTQFFGFLILGFELGIIGLAVLWKIRQRAFVAIPRWLLIGGAVAVVAILIPPLAIIFKHFRDWGIGRNATGLTFVSPTRILRDVLDSVIFGTPIKRREVIPYRVGYLTVLGIGAALSLALNRLSKRALLVISFLLLYFFVPIGALLVISFLRPIYLSSRYLIVITPAYYLLLAWSLGHLRRISPALVGAALIFITVAWQFAAQDFLYNPRYDRDNHRAWGEYLTAHVRPGDAIVLNSATVFQLFEHYYRGPEVPWIGLPPYNCPFPECVYPVMEQLAQEHERIWIVYAHTGFTDPNRLVKQWAEGHMLKINWKPIDALSMVMYVSCFLPGKGHYAELPPLQHDLNVTFGDELRLYGYNRRAATASSAEPYYLQFYWQPRHQLAADYYINLRLVDDAGMTWGHNNGMPYDGLHPTSHWFADRINMIEEELHIAPGAPPGVYHLEMTVTHPETGAPLELFDAAANLLGTKLALGDVQVTRPTALTVADLAIQHPLEAHAGAVDFLGYNFITTTVDAGDFLHLAAYYRANDVQNRDLVAVWQIVDAAGAVRRSEEYPLHNRGWRAGDLIKGQYRLLVPANLLGGDYTLRLQLRAVDRAEFIHIRRAWRLLAEDHLNIAAISVTAGEHNFTAPAPATTAQFNFDDAAELVGYGLTMSEHELRLQLYWRVLAETDTSYTAFVHLLNEQGEIAAQRDSIPANGTRPTTSWVRGEYITDEYVLDLTDVPAGDYTLAVGLYNPQTWERLSVRAAGGEAQEEGCAVLTEVTYSGRR